MDIQERIAKLEAELATLKQGLDRSSKHILETRTYIDKNDEQKTIHLILEDGETFIETPEGEDCFSEGDEGYDPEGVKWLLWGFIDRLAAKGLLNDIKHRERL
jgi:hypothetical protein